MSFKISKNVVFLHIFRMKLSQSPSSFRSCQVTLAHFQLSLPVCDQHDALRQKVRRRLWPRPDAPEATSVSFNSPNTPNWSAPRPRPLMAARLILMVDRLCLDLLSVCFCLCQYYRLVSPLRTLVHLTLHFSDKHSTVVIIFLNCAVFWVFFVFMMSERLWLCLIIKHARTTDARPSLS